MNQFINFLCFVIAVFAVCLLVFGLACLLSV
jgi:hypothetical protein